MIHPLRGGMLSVILTGILIGACAASQNVALVPGRPDVATKLVGKWKGHWYADVGSTGRFELEVTSVDGDRVAARGTWYDTVVGTAPFFVSGGFKDGALWLPIHDNYWFNLKLYELSGEKKYDLRGRYSTVGRGQVYEGDIRVLKQ